MKTWSSVVWGVVTVCALFAGGCEKETEEPVPPAGGTCVAGASEGCTCEGGLSGLRSCNASETWDACVCGCVPECSGRSCGPDPICGSSCGACGADELCNDSGQCEPNCTAGCIGRECGTESVCGTSCGTCIDTMVCDASAGRCNATVLTLRGRTIPDADVDVLIGDAIFSGRSDQAGRYLIPIPSAMDANAFVRIRAIQVTDDAFAAARMSFAGVLAELSAAAGPDLIVDEREHPGVVADAQSTIRWAVLYAANGGRMFANAAELENAENNANAPLSGQEWLIAVAWLETGISLAPPPSFSNSLEVVENIDALHSITSAYSSLELYASSPLDLGRNTILEEESNHAPFPADFQGTYFSELLIVRDGIVGAGGARWDFNADGTGNYHRGDADLHPPLAFTWSIDQGAVAVIFDRPVTYRVGHYMTTADIVARVRDENARQQIELFLGQGFLLDVNYETIGMRFTRLQDGAKMDWVAVQENIHWRFAESLQPFGITVRDENILEWNDAVTWRRADSLEYIPFTREEIVGDWVLPLGAQSDEPAYLQPFPAGRNLIFAVSARFGAGGDATITSGRHGLQSTGTWQLDQSGRLVLILGGARNEYAKLYDSGGAERGIMYSVQSPATTVDVQTSYGRGVKVDPTLAPAPALVMRSDGKYWQSTARAFAAHKNEAGLYPDREVFGFTFDTEEDASRVSVEVYEEPFERIVVFEQTWSWEIEQNELALERRWDKTHTARCTMADPSCVPFRLWRWTPIAKDGPRLVVLEWELWLNRYGEFFSNQFAWNEAQQVWIHNLTAERLNIDDVGYTVYPRVNSYYPEDIPF